MKKTLTILCFWLLCNGLLAQKACNYTQLLAQGKKYANAKIPRYDSALLKFNSARRCDPEKGAEIDVEIEKVFNGMKQQRDWAISAETRAVQERLKTEQALHNFRKSSEINVRFILSYAEERILKLDYEGAWEKLRAAATLNVLKQEVTDAMLELAFWFVESNQYHRASHLLDTIAQFTGRKSMSIGIVKAPLATFDRHLYKLLQEKIIAYDDSVSFLRWHARYYPKILSIKGGDFTIGCDLNWGDEDCEQAPKIKLSDFEMGESEITFWQFGLFCAATGRNIERYTPDWGIFGDNPAIRLTWFEAVTYTNWLNNRWGLDSVYQFTGNDFNGLKKNGNSAFRLPSEAEWEYAARGGIHLSPFEYSGDSNVDAILWHLDNSAQQGVLRTHQVKSKSPNKLGLYDMSGNVWEWCQDWHAGYQVGNLVDPLGPQEGESRVVRGGCYAFDHKQSKVSNRNALFPRERDVYYGFRIVKGH